LSKCGCRMNCFTNCWLRRPIILLSQNNLGFAAKHEYGITNYEFHQSPKSEAI